MKTEICIKGHVFGAGRPVVCVPVVEKTAEGILGSVTRLAEQAVAMIEWRIDWFEHGKDPEAVKEVLNALRPLVRKMVFLGTFRSSSQGGEQDISPKDYRRLNCLAAQTGVLDMVDLEFFEQEDPKEEVGGLRETGIRVVASDHHFTETPESKEIYRRFQKMCLSGADFSKLAVMPQKKADVLRLMEGLLSIKERYPHHHFIAMSMGEKGVISRLLGQWYGSEVTFAAFGKSSAPGQVPYEEAVTILKQIEKWVE